MIIVLYVFGSTYRTFTKKDVLCPLKIFSYVKLWNIEFLHWIIRQIENVTDDRILYQIAPKTLKQFNSQWNIPGLCECKGSFVKQI